MLKRKPKAFFTDYLGTAKQRNPERAVGSRCFSSSVRLFFKYYTSYLAKWEEFTILKFTNTGMHRVYISFLTVWKVSKIPHFLRRDTIRQQTI